VGLWLLNHKMIFGIKAKINLMIKKSLLLIGVQLTCFKVHKKWAM
jgi:hypothetical protein